MPEQKKYPTVYDPYSTWTIPYNTTGPEDDVCGYTKSTTLRNDYLYMSSYGFSIPSDATITGVFIAVKHHLFSNYCAYGIYLKFCFNPPVRFGAQAQYITADCHTKPVSNQCAQTHMSAELDITSLGPWLPSDFNSEDFQTYWRHHGESGYLAESYADACYIRVTYTEPSAVPAPKGDGLAWVTQ